MPENQWWYSKDGQRQGPVSEEMMRDMLASGTIDPDTQVWRSDMTEWLALRDSDLVKPPEEPAAAVKPDEVIAPTPSEGDTPLHVFPWRRWFARTIDNMAISLVLVFAMVPPILAVLIWIPLEGLLLSSWGLTPGKWIMGVYVKDAAGKMLSFGEATRRAFTVWVVGLGLGIPIVSIITMVAAYFYLTSKGITWWDKTQNLRVEYHPVGTTQKVLMWCCIALAAFGLASLVVGMVVFMKHHY